MEVSFNLIFDWVCAAGIVTGISLLCYAVGYYFVMRARHDQDGGNAMIDKYGCVDEEKKTAKAVRILKAVFKGLNVVVKWSNENLTIGKVVKWGMILLIVGTIAKAAIFG